jgi:hypothetical protein
MKKLLLASLSVLAMGAQAAAVAPSPGNPVSHPFSVIVNFTPTCIANSANAAANELLFTGYTGFQTAAVSAQQITSSLNCSNNMRAPTASLSQTGGVVAGLTYTLTMGARQVSYGTNSSQTSSTAAAADVYSVTVDGSIAGGQPGEVNAPNTQAQKVTWTF